MSIRAAAIEILMCYVGDPEDFPSARMLEAEAALDALRAFLAGNGFVVRAKVATEGMHEAARADLSISFGWLIGEPESRCCYTAMIAAGQDPLAPEEGKDDAE